MSATMPAKQTTSVAAALLSLAKQAKNKHTIRRASAGSIVILDRAKLAQLIVKSDLEPLRGLSLDDVWDKLEVFPRLLSRNKSEAHWRRFPQSCGARREMQSYPDFRSERIETWAHPSFDDVPVATAAPRTMKRHRYFEEEDTDSEDDDEEDNDWVPGEGVAAEPKVESPSPRKRRQTRTSSLATPATPTPNLTSGSSASSSTRGRPSGPQSPSLPSPSTNEKPPVKELGNTRSPASVGECCLETCNAKTSIPEWIVLDDPDSENGKSRTYCHRHGLLAMAHGHDFVVRRER
ncbi:hypothetical protein HMN09_00149400 [Mycena chlorophos]|uniref:Uncharacterized protein n=1 Tax=Mycena chlorophos TaxID=658473 RepID=A0A8H6TNV5_MYCCL|nr:hypothetical protein HMN09_00149400 [Mycena chlorophos]